MGTEQSGSEKLCIRQHNQQLFMNKAALGPVRQIIDNRLIRLGGIFDNLVDFQRPDRVCSSFGTAFKFARLIQISNIGKRGFFFLSIQQVWNILLTVLRQPLSL